MNYIQQAFNNLHDWWRYLVGLIIIFIMWQLIGVIPLIGSLIGSVGMDGLANGNFPDEIPEMIELLGTNLFLFLMLIMFVFGLIAVFFVAKYLHKQSIINLTTTRKKIDWKRFWFIFILWGTVITTFTVIGYYVEPESFEWNFQLKPFLILSVIAILLIPIQTSFEEYLFRGYLMQGLGVSSLNRNFPFVLLYFISSILIYIYLYFNFDIGFFKTLGYFIISVGLLLGIIYSKPFNSFKNTSFYEKFFKLLKRNSTPLIITSTVFGLLHIANPEIEQLGYIIMVVYVGIGFFLGIITLMDEGLELALGFHAANNLCTALLVTANWTAFQTDSILKDISDPKAAVFADVLVPVFIVFPILLFILSKKYKWTNWKDKLFGKVVEPSKEDYKILEGIDSEV